MNGQQWLIDTNVVSEIRKAGRANANVLRWAKSTDFAGYFLSLVTLAELRYGVETLEDSGFQAELNDWIDKDVRVVFAGRILAVDEDVLVAWRRLLKAGQRMQYTYSQPDALIAATALVHGLGVVTRNTADFERAGVPLLNPWNAL